MSAGGASAVHFKPRLDAVVVELVAASGQLGTGRRQRFHAHDAHRTLPVLLLPDIGRVALELLHKVHGRWRHSVELRDNVPDDGVYPARALEQQQRVLDLRIGRGGVAHIHADSEVHGRPLVVKFKSAACLAIESDLGWPMKLKPSWLQSSGSIRRPLCADFLGGASESVALLLSSCWCRAVATRGVFDSGL